MKHFDVIMFTRKTIDQLLYNLHYTFLSDPANFFLKNRKEKSSFINMIAVYEPA